MERNPLTRASESRENANESIRRGTPVRFNDEFFRDLETGVLRLPENHVVPDRSSRYLVAAVFSPDTELPTFLGQNFDEEDVSPNAIIMQGKGPVTLLADPNSSEDFSQPFDFNGYWDTDFLSEEQEQAYLEKYGDLFAIPYSYLEPAPKS